MNTLSKIRIANKDFTKDFTHISIQQTVGCHNIYEIKIGLVESTQSFKGILAKTANELMGQDLSIQINDSIHEGIVTHVSLSRISRQQSELVVKGESYTILADDGSQIRSFSDKTLQQIIDIVLGEYGNISSKLKVKPNYITKIPYCVQYNESNFQFATRLAARYAEWFFVDGNEIYFGKPKSSETIKLMYEKDIDAFEIELRAMPVNFELKAYDYEKNSNINSKSSYSGKMNEFVQIAHNKSKDKIYPNTKTIPLLSDIDSEDLNEMKRRREEAYLNDMTIVSGITAQPAIKIGGKIHIVDERKGLEGATEDYGEYEVIKVVHEIFKDGTYVNNFEATPTEPSSPPLSSPIQPPFCDTQLAEVVENNDTKGLGRIRVQFLWQKGTSEKSPWIRVASPYSGKDKGFFIIPEKGDQVLVAFEQNDPEVPYVITGMYNGEAKPEHTHHENNKKAIKTRGGIEILMNDEKGKETFAITSPMDVTINAAGGKITVTAKGDIKIESSSGNITISAPNKIKMEAADIILEAKSSISLKAMKISSKADISINEEAAQVAIKGTATASLKAAMVEVNGSGVTNIQGGIIKLN